MKAIINGKTYNTETATELFTNGTGRTADFRDWYNTFFVTKKGTFFMEYWGGAMTCYAETWGNNSSEGRGIKVVTKEYVIEELKSDSYEIDEEKIIKFLGIEEA